MVKIGILGASGYTGAELLRLLGDHPQAEIVALTAERQAGRAIGEVFPQLAVYDLPTLVKVDDVDVGGLDVLFCCLPHATTQAIVKALPRGPKVIDLSADFRLRDPQLYEHTYGHAHQALELQHGCRSRTHLGVTLLHARDDLAARIVKGRVTQVLASAHTEIWARASDAQIAALSRDGFWVAYRDGVDRVGCADIRRDPQAGRRALPPPFYEGSAPRVYLAQLDVPTHVLPGLADELAQHNLLLLESSGATLTLSASPTGIARLRRMPHVRWTAPYGVRERILSLAMSVLSQEVPCGDAGNAAGDGDGAMVGSTSTPDRTLRALADWIRREPKAPLPLTAVLFEDSASFRALVRSVGATAVQGTPGDPMITFTIPRHALPAIASHPALRVLEPYAEASIGLTTDSPRPVNGR